jgi:hypothetical protein
MSQLAASRIRCAVFASGLIFAPALSSQQPKAIAAAPVPVQIVAARKVFISYAGADIVSQAAFKRAGEPDQAYTHFYSAMQSWGRYEIVSAPADADLVFEIRFTAPISGCETCYQPQMGLTILDAKTHFILWTLTAPVQGAFRKATWLKNFDQGLNALMDDLKKLSAPSVATGEPANK